MLSFYFCFIFIYYFIFCVTVSSVVPHKFVSFSKYQYMFIVTTLHAKTEEKISDEDAVVIERCAKSLKKLHSVGVLHGDVRLANFLVPPDNNAPVIICDFGRSEILDRNKDEDLARLDQEFNNMFKRVEEYW